MKSLEHSNCGVGFLISLKNDPDHNSLKQVLHALNNVEHRGGVGIDGILGDGAGVLTDIPWELIGHEKNSVAVATLFAPADEEKYNLALSLFENTFFNNGLKILEYRVVPTNDDVLSPFAQKNKPQIIQAIIERPEHCRTNNSFDKMLYFAKQMLLSNHKYVGLHDSFFFTSLSCQTIVYKALVKSKDLPRFYPDLENPLYKTKLGLFHRRFSTNTLSSWDKVQPFRLIAHNGEINTIEGNKTAAISREKSLGLREDELIQHEGTSDSGNMNGMVEALKYRSSIPSLTEIMAIMVPPALSKESPYFDFWSRAMEPWDGPALIAFCDGKRIGARLDRNGFRPARWAKTENYFYLASEAGSFNIEKKEIIQQGTLYAGRSVSVHIPKGEVSFLNPNQIDFYKDATFDSRLIPLPYIDSAKNQMNHGPKKELFYYTKEDLSKELYPAIIQGKEDIGSMGDTAKLPAFSGIHRSIYDYFYQNFAQVTNPPLDYIREKMVTELKVYLGRKPNIFEPKEMIPPPMALKLESPIISLGQMEEIQAVEKNHPSSTIRVGTIDICFDRNSDDRKLKKRLNEIAELATDLVQNGKNIIVLSDRKASFERPGIPAILALRSVQQKLNLNGLRLRISLIIDSAEIRNSHQVAVLIGFGASAICPYLSLELARFAEIPAASHLFAVEREKNLINALEQGLLKIMAKRGISVVRSYQGAELFTIIGLGEDITENLFPNHNSYVGGITFNNLIAEIQTRTKQTQEESEPNNFLYKEHASGKKGESHSITSKAARLIHRAIDENITFNEAGERFQEFKSILAENVHIRDMFDFKTKNEVDKANKSLTQEILRTFGCGAMSFGAISAEAQRDLILAFNQFGGRSNSGEGGENPYFETDGISATTKQIASGRFGVTAEYLTTGNEIQIKIAQGAKPGEGGQLMGLKVDKAIAKARFASEGVDLISPPPQHDIYSIEDLKQLIYELKQLHPIGKISVKLVSGKNIGAIALGVVKAGADIIQISGGDGGTGAAPLMSMKHAGLPWEFGLLEVHKMLTENGYRQKVVLRADGGLRSGDDIVKAALLGAEEFDFGKMALVSQGCIMARICEKNTCPAGIATHDEKFKQRYKGKVSQIVNYFTLVAEDTAKIIHSMGHNSLKDIIGKRSLLTSHNNFLKIKDKFNLNLDYFLGEDIIGHNQEEAKTQINALNQEIIDDYTKATKAFKKQYSIKVTDRAIPTSLSGYIIKNKVDKKEISLHFVGSAGQGFGSFTTSPMHIKLRGEANDSVAKGMSGGMITIAPHPDANFKAQENVLVGNACLYGATGGKLFIQGLASDRFAVRNSGAQAVVKGVGLHACEYMTSGRIIILGRVLDNIGAGMSGGEIYILKKHLGHINSESIKPAPIQAKDLENIKRLLTEYRDHTDSEYVDVYINDIKSFDYHFVKLVPKT